MTVPADTAAAPAATTETPEVKPSTTPETTTTSGDDGGEFEIQDRLNRATAEELSEWQLKGTIPAKKDKAGKPEASPASTADTAAAAAAASTQKTTPKETQRETKSEKRWRELSERVGALQRENEELKRGKTTVPEAIRDTQSSQPAPDGKSKTEPKPKITENSVVLQHLKNLVDLVKAELGAKSRSTDVIAERDAQILEAKLGMHEEAHEFAMQEDQQAHEHEMADKTAANAALTQATQIQADQSAQAGQPESAA